MFGRTLARWAAKSCGLLLAAVAAPLPAGYINVADGSLADWGITVQTGNSSNVGMTQWGDGIAPSPHNVSSSGVTGTTPTTRAGFQFAFHVEDSNDASDSYQVGPQYGGQNFDAEFLGAGIEDGTLKVGLLTGQRRDNGLANFAPGDLIISTSIGVFGIEIGGGAGVNNGSPGDDLAATAGSAGSTYSSSNGWASTTGTMSTNSNQTAGSVWFNPSWITNTPVNPMFDVQMLTTGTSGFVGQLDPTQFLFSFDDSLGAHAILEMGIPLDWFSGATINYLQWAPSCGNDLLRVGPTVTTIPTNSVPTPEPSTMILLGIGGLGLVGRSIRRRRTAANS